jgi:hypothetical protein
MSVTIDILSQRMEVIEKQMKQIKMILDKMEMKDTSNEFKQSNKTAKKSDNKTKKNSKKNNIKNGDENLDTNKKKKISGYILFSKTMRDDAKNKLTTNNYNPKQSEIMKELGSMWKSLTANEQDDWKTKANNMN